MRDPDLLSVYAKAWHLRMQRLTRPDHEATLAAWMVTGPFHVAWNWWMISLIHLRELPGVKPAHKRYPLAEYEAMIVSVDPASYPIDIDQLEHDDTGLHFLRPIDLVYQFHGVTDAQAISIAEDMVRAIIDGHASPDSDWNTWWKAILDTTVNHYRTGVHS